MLGAAGPVLKTSSTRTICSSWALVPARPSDLLEDLAEHCRSLGIEPQFFKRVEPIIPGANNVVPLTEPVLVSRLVIDLVHLGPSPSVLGGLIS